MRQLVLKRTEKLLSLVPLLQNADFYRKTVNQIYKLQLSTLKSDTPINKVDLSEMLDATECEIKLMAVMKRNPGPENDQNK